MTQPEKNSPKPKSSSAIRQKTLSLVRSAGTTRVLLRKQIWIWPIVAAVFLGIVGWSLRGRIENELKRELASGIQTILNADVTALRLWMQAEKATAESVAKDARFVELVERLSGLGAGGEVTQLDILQSDELRVLRRNLSPVLEAHGHNGFLVLDATGKVLAAARNDPIGLMPPDDETKHRILSIIENQESAIMLPVKSLIVLPDRDGQLRAGVPTMFALAPVIGKEGKAIAALGLRIRPDEEFTEILRVARSGETGETYAFNREGVLISQSRFDNDLIRIGLLADQTDSILSIEIRDPGVDMTRGQRPAELRSKQPLTLMAAQAAAGNSGVNVDGYRDYRGVPVIGAWTWLDEYDFGVATEIDVAEAYRTLNMLRSTFWGLFALLGAASVAIFVFTVVIARLNREARRAVLETKQLGQYTLDEKLAEGGMGVVYRAHHAMLHRPTAVKFLDADKTNEQTIARFEREVRLTSQLNHPNTIAVYDYGRTPEGIFYYAMEYLDGLNLDEFVQQWGPQPEGRVIGILRQVCGSLAEAHGVGLIHRDIKPANMLINQRGGLYDFVKLLDFGLVKAVDSSREATLTSAGSLAGTPLYLSPEGVERPQSVDARSDLYAVGAVGYFLLTGTPVFDGDNVFEIINQHSKAAPEPPSERLGKNVSQDFERLLLACLEKDPDKRPQTAVELTIMLDACGAAESWSQADAAQWWEQCGKTKADRGATSITDDGTLAATIITPQPRSPQPDET